MQNKNSVSELVLGPAIDDSKIGRDIEHAYHLVVAADGTLEISSFLSRRLKQQVEIARSKFRPEEGDERPPTRIDLGLDNLFGALDFLVEHSELSTKDAKAVGDALRCDFEQESLYYLELQRVTEQDAPALKPTPEMRTLLLAEQQLLRGARSLGIDRNETLSDSMQLFNEALSVSDGWSCIAWFQYGWLQYKHGHNIASAAEAFDKAVECADEPLLKAFCLRHVAHLKYISHDYAGAFSAVNKAMRLYRHHEPYLEGARYAVLSDKPELGANLLRKCVELYPLAIVAILVDPELSSLGTSLNTLVDNVTRDLVKTAQDSIAAVKKARVRAVDALTMLKLESKKLPSINDAELLNQVQQADFCTAWSVAAKAKDVAEEIITLSRHEIKTLILQHNERVAEIQHQLGELWNDRETAVDLANKAKDELIVSVRHERAQADEAWDHRNGCGLGMFGAFVSALVYCSILLFGRLSPGVAGMERPAAWICGVIFSASIIIPSILQIVYGIQRAMLENEFAARIKTIETMADKKKEAADKIYHERIPPIRAELTKAEQELKRSEQALEVLEGSKRQTVPQAA